MRDITHRLKFVFLFIFFLLVGTFTLPNVQASATGNYLEVKQSEFTVTAIETTSRSYSVTLIYQGEEQFPVTTFDISGLTVYNSRDTQNGKAVYLKQVSVSDAQTIQIVFSATTEGNSGELSIASLGSDIIYFPAGTLLPYATVSGDYVGLSFVEGLTLYANDGDPEWTTESANEKVVVEQIAPETVTLSYDGEEKALVAEMCVSYQSEKDLSFATDVSVTIDEVIYSGDISITQNGNEDVFRLSFPAIEADVGVVSFSNGVFTAIEENVTYTLSESLTFHKFLDGSWSTEEFVVLVITAGEQTTQGKVAAKGVYTFAEPELSNVDTFLGWSFDGKLYHVGASVELSAYSGMTMETNAVCIGYEMINGASIRYDQTGECSGIRFASVLKRDGCEDYLPFLKKMGMIVMPTDMIGTEEFTWENYNGDKQAKNFVLSGSEVDFKDDDDYTLYASIVKVLEANYNREFSARAYIIVDYDGEETYIWEDGTVSRNVYYVATRVIAEEGSTGSINASQRKILDTYINGVANVVYENHVARLICPAETPVITGISLMIAETKVTLYLSASVTKISCVTYNGVRIKNYTQIFENDVLQITFDITEETA